MDLYQILQIPSDSSPDEIRQAYLKLAKQYHPDKNLNNQEEATQKFKEIKMAYEVLSDPQKRQQYDLMNHSKKLELYKLFQLLCQLAPDAKIPEYINMFYQDQDEFKNDLNNLALEKMGHKVITGLTNYCLKYIQDNVLASTSDA